MGKVPKEIVNKLQQIEQLKMEVSNWIGANLDCEGCDTLMANLVTEPSGQEQGTAECKEWCAQSTVGDSSDWYYGDYYWETEVPGKYLHMPFEL